MNHHTSIPSVRPAARYSYEPKGEENMRFLLWVGFIFNSTMTMIGSALLLILINLILLPFLMVFSLLDLLLGENKVMFHEVYGLVVEKIVGGVFEMYSRSYNEFRDKIKGR
jgi:fatty acid desaturase